MRHAAWAPCVLAAVAACAGCTPPGESRLQDLTAVVEIQPESVDFGAALVGTRSERTVTVRNRGNTSVRLSAVSLVGDEAFVLEPPAATTLGPDESVPLRIIFLAPADRDCAATLQVAAEGQATIAIPVHADGEPLPACDDGNACTLDHYDATAGLCIAQPVSGSCDDGDVCTEGDSCADGACTGIAVTCDDGIACTVDACASASGCTATPVDALCDDGDPCTTDTCGAGGCGHTTAPDGTSCGPADACTSLSVCWQGACRGVPMPDGIPCDDGDACTTGDVCQAGVCQGFGCGSLLAEGVAGPTQAVVVDADAVYFATGGGEGGRILRVPLGGGSATTLATGVTVLALVGSGGELFWVDGAHHAVIAMPKSGGGQRVVVSHLDPGSTAFAVDDAYVYWGSSSDGTILRTSRNPEQAGIAHLLAGDAGLVSSVAVDSYHLYWTDTRGTVMRVEKNGGVPVVFFREEGRIPYVVRAAAGIVAWLTLHEDGTRSVWRADIPAQTRTRLHHGLERYGQLEIHDDAVYAGTVDPGGPIHRFQGGKHILHATIHGQSARPFAVGDALYHVDDGVVLRTALDDGLRIIGTELGQMNFVAMNGGHIYWSVRSWEQGSIQRIARQGGEPEVVLPDVAYVVGVAVDDQALYHAQFWDPLTGNGRIWRSALDGSGATVLTESPGYPKRLFVTATHAAWFSEAGEGGIGNGWFNTVPLVGGDRESVGGTLNVGSIAQDDDSFFWIGTAGDDPGGAALLSTNVTAPGVVPVVPWTQDQWLSSVGVDDEYAYFFRGHCRLWRVPRAGGEPEVFVDFAGRRETSYYYCGITSVDDDAVWWQVLQYNGDNYSVGFTSLMRADKVTGRAIEVASFRGRWRELLRDGTGLTAVEMDAGDIQHVPRELGRPTVLAVTSVQPGRMLTAAAGSVYWANRAPDGLGSIVRMEVGAETPRLVAGGLRRPSAIVADGQAVYWTDEAEGTVMRVALEGGTPEVLARGQRQPQNLVRDGNHLYWTTRSDDGPGMANAAVRTVPRTGGTVATLAAGLARIDDVAVANGELFFLSDQTVHLDRGDVFLVLANDATAFAADESGVYHVSGSRLFRRELGTGNVTLLASTDVAPVSDLVLDATHLYWLDWNGRLMRVAKDGGWQVPEVLQEVGDPAVLGALALLPNAVAVSLDGAVRVFPR